MWLLPALLLLTAIVLSIPLSAYFAWLMDGKYRAHRVLKWFEDLIDTGPQDGNSGDASFTFHDSDSLLTFLCSTDGSNYSASTCNTEAGPGTGSATVSSPPTGSR